jgi:DNA-binding response OmpR family regulator
MLNIQDVTVLYIDADTVIREKTTLLLYEHGLNVFEVTNLSEAYEIFRKNRVDIILMDILLPNEIGLDFIRFLRQKELLTPVIITTSLSEQNLLLDAINLEISRYLLKPFSSKDLVNAFHHVIKKLFMRYPINFTHLHDGYCYDPINKTLNNFDGKIIDLSKKEYHLIELLLANKENIAPYSVIESTVWEDSYMSMDALRTLVRGIRKKTYPTIISNHNGIGYKINLH